MKPSQPGPKGPVQNWPMHQWSSWIWYAMMILTMLWMWQQAFKQGTVHTIPYSEFKQAVAAGEVVECAIHDDEIVGTIQPKAGPQAAAVKAAAEATSANTVAKLKSAEPQAGSEPAEKELPRLRHPKAGAGAKCADGNG